MKFALFLNALFLTVAVTDAVRSNLEKQRYLKGGRGPTKAADPTPYPSVSEASGVNPTITPTVSAQPSATFTPSSAPSTLPQLNNKHSLTKTSTPTILSSTPGLVTASPFTPPSVSSISSEPSATAMPSTMPSPFISAEVPASTSAPPSSAPSVTTQPSAFVNQSGAQVEGL